MFQTQKGSRRFKRIENRNGVFALLVSSVGHGSQTYDETVKMLNQKQCCRHGGNAVHKHLGAQLHHPDVVYLLCGESPSCCDAAEHGPVLHLRRDF